MKLTMYAVAIGTIGTGLVVLAGVARLFGVDLTTIDPIRDVMPWFMSAITLYMTFLQGRKTWKAWLWGLANQLLWLGFIIDTHTWGLLPLNAGLWVLYIRNLRLWYKEERVSMNPQVAAPTDWQRFYASTDEMRRKPW